MANISKCDLSVIHHLLGILDEFAKMEKVDVIYGNSVINRREIVEKILIDYYNCYARYSLSVISGCSKKAHSISEILVYLKEFRNYKYLDEQILDKKTVDYDALIKTFINESKFINVDKIINNNNECKIKIKQLMNQ